MFSLFFTGNIQTIGMVFINTTLLKLTILISIHKNKSGRTNTRSYFTSLRCLWVLLIFLITRFITSIADGPIISNILFLIHKLHFISFNVLLVLWILAIIKPVRLSIVPTRSCQTFSIHVPLIVSAE